MSTAFSLSFKREKYFLNRFKFGPYQTISPKEVIQLLKEEERKRNLRIKEEKEKKILQTLFDQSH